MSATAPTGIVGVADLATASDWREAVRLAAGRLRDSGAASPAYVERCLGIVEETGPYIVIAPGVALAHARPEDGAIRPGLALVRLRRPVRFGHPDNDPVDLVFAFCSPDSSGHIGLLAALGAALGRGLNSRLRAAAGEADLRRLLEEVLNGNHHPSTR